MNKNKNRQFLDVDSHQKITNGKRFSSINRINSKSKLTGQGPLALYQKVKNYILEKITNGEWPSETKIPSENQLVATLNVSRMTANRALRELTAEGHLIRIQGVGTFVAPPKPQASFLEIRSIADEIESIGGEHSCKVYVLRKEKAGKEIAQAMDIQKEDSVFHSIIVHSDSGRPVQLSDRYVNPYVAPKYLEQDFTKITPSKYLLENAPLQEVEHIIEAILPDRLTQDLLKIHANEPCLLLHRRTWSYDRIATKSKFTYPGTRYQLAGRFHSTESIGVG